MTVDRLIGNQLIGDAAAAPGLLALWAGATEVAAEDAAHRLVGARGGLLRLAGGLVVEGRDAASGVEVVRVSGPLYARSIGWRDSYEELAERLAELEADNAVRGVLLRIDSPGGDVANLRMATDAVRSLRAKKPVWAIADVMAASAAYWIGSQTDRLTVAPGGQVGSIGVIVRHFDQVERAKQMGVKVTEIVFGARKNEFSSFKHLDEQGRAHLQALADTFGEEFVSAVAEGRGVTPDVVRATEGAVVTGLQAIELGLADGEATFPETLAGLIARVGKGSGFGFAAGPGSKAAEDKGMEDNKVGAAPPLPTDAVGAAAASTGAPAARQAEPSAPRVDMNVLAGRMSECGLNDLGLASALQASAASTQDAAQIAQLFAIAKDQGDFLRAQIANGRGLKAADVQLQLARHRAEESERTAVSSAVLPHEGMGRKGKGPDAGLMAAVDRYNAELEAQRARGF